MPLLRFAGVIKHVEGSSTSNEPMDIFEIVSLAKRLNISFDDMKQMTFISLMNILLSTVSNENETRQATQDDINALFGG